MRDELAEHDWQCTKCLEKVYLRNQPPPLYHRKRPDTVRGMAMNWEGLDDVEKIGCTELVLKAVHES